MGGGYISWGYATRHDGMDAPIPGRASHGTEVPQLTGEETYTYLGTALPTAWHGKHTHEHARRRIVEACVKVTNRIGYLDISPNDMRRAIHLAINGIIGSYGRSTPLTYEDCVSIEAAKVKAFKANHYLVAEPRSAMYDTYHAGGMEEEHAYAVAGAAIIDQVDRALGAPEHSTARRMVVAAIQETVLRLGGRPGNPLEWHPSHLEGELREDNIIEAYLLARIRT